MLPARRRRAKCQVCDGASTSGPVSTNLGVGSSKIALVSAEFGCDFRTKDQREEFTLHLKKHRPADVWIPLATKRRYDMVLLGVQSCLIQSMLKQVYLAEMGLPEEERVCMRT